jgi:anti-sigma-K factor RskA
LNVQEYIASGILESYVLGVTSAEESAEVQRLAAQHPEIQAELNTLSAALEEYALTFEQEPPAHLRQRVLGALEDLGEPPSGATSSTDGEEDRGREIPFSSVPPLSVHRSPRFTWWVAASWGLLVLSLLANLLLYTRWRATETRLTLAESQNSTLARRVEVQQARFTEELAFLQNPSTRKIALKGTPQSPSANATVFWNAAERRVYLASAGLPAPPAGKQYQLWAIVGGKPLDAGVFDVQTGLARLKDIPVAQAFAISLEATGGSTTEAGPKGPVVSMGGV